MGDEVYLGVGVRHLTTIEGNVSAIGIVHSIRDDHYEKDSKEVDEEGDGEELILVSRTVEVSA